MNLRLMLLRSGETSTFPMEKSKYNLINNNICIDVLLAGYWGVEPTTDKSI